MCGISGCISKQPEAKICVIKSINRLQNRGYDSSGIAVSTPNKIFIKKYISDVNRSAIQNLNSDPELELINGFAAIGHTRWATHGAVTLENAHPHSSADAHIVLIHNGIIENYESLKEFLLTQNYDFYGSTDSEIVTKYISYIKSTDQHLSALNGILSGSWAILFLVETEPDKIYFMKNGSPMLIGFNQTKDKTMIVSELAGFDEDIKTYVVIADMDCGYVTATDIQSNFIYTAHSVIKSDMDLSPAPFNHWTLKEICDQPSAITNCLNGRLIFCPNALSYQIKFTELEMHPIKNFFIDADHIIFCGCGTSLHAAKIGALYFTDLLVGKTLDVVDGADFEANQIPPNRLTILILLSQSGETKDLIRALEIGKKNNLKSIGLINIENSTIAREVDVCIYLKAGRENAVASTKCFTNQVVLLLLLGLWLNSNTKEKYINLTSNPDIKSAYIKALLKLATDCEKIIQQSLVEIKKMLRWFPLNQQSCFILGKSYGELIAREAALKIKEISYVHAEGYASSSLKHGPFALLAENIPVIMIVPDDKFYTKNHNATQEIKARASPVIHITNVMTDTTADHVFKYETDSELFPILAIVPLQVLAYEISISREINPDYPRNLAKVVTVE